MIKHEESATLELANVTKSYGNKTALNDFSYTFGNGIYGLLGVNGAGKSTLMNLITDNISRDSGRICYDGTEIRMLGASYRKNLGYMPQQQGLYEQFSARAFLFYIAELKGIRKKNARKQIDELLEIVNLTGDADRKTGGYSGGMKQRVMLAQALLGEPKLLLIDEPTAGLDPRERVNFRQYIAELSRKMIIIYSTHVVSDIESIADRILIVKNGKLVADDSPSNLSASCAQGNTLEDAFLGYMN